MAQTTIEWTSQRLADGRIVAGYTLNGWSGCTKVILPSGKPDAQCVFCYAEREEDKRRGRSRWGKGNPRTLFKGWRANLRRWNEEAKKDGVHPFVFGHSLSDWADREVPDSWRDEVMSLAEVNDQLIYLWLTKRVDYAAEYFARRYPSGLPDHFRFGFSAGSPEAFAVRNKDAVHVDAAVRFVSIEPYIDPFAPLLDEALAAGQLQWVLSGGETGSFDQIAPRVAHSEWYRELRDVCVAYKVPFHFKQWGNLAPLTQSQAGVTPQLQVGVTPFGTRSRNFDAGYEIHGFLGGSTGKHAHGRRLDGVEWNQHPEVAHAR